MYQKGDFHLHSNKSDGKLPPKGLVRLAQKYNLDIMAITDHDTTDGCNEAIIEGSILGIKVVPGIELSTLHQGESIHILGYFTDDRYKNSEFQLFLKDMANYRVWRAKKIAKNLNTYFNIKINCDKMLDDSNGVIARPHIARAIIESGYSYSQDYIFDNFISKSSPAFVPNKKVSISEGIKLLKNVGAVVVLAHPVLVKKSNIDDLLSFDFDGVEAIYSMNTENDSKKFILKAKDYNKFYTAGSDFHGIDQDDTRHKGMASVSLQGEALEEFVKRLAIE